MPARSSDVARARSRLGVATRLGTAAEQTEARRDLAAAKLELFIERTVAAAPPLSTEQRQRLAALLWPAGDDNHAAAS